MTYPPPIRDMQYATVDVQLDVWDSYRYTIGWEKIIFMNSCIRIKCHRDSKGHWKDDDVFMYSSALESVFSLFPSIIPAWFFCLFFCFFPCKMHVFFCFSVFLNVILVSYKSEIAFHPLAPGVFLSQQRFLIFFFFLLGKSECWSGFLLYSQHENYFVLLNRIPNGMATYRNIW